ncbi:MAG: ABC transporter permease [Phycisphaerales bacterium]|nr:MAG: ABC transporter permease [Phycisphaerales bacterium]
MGTLIQDVRYAVRTLSKRPGFAIVIILTLAFGIGINIAVFTVLNGAVLRPIPYEDSERLVVVSGTQKGAVVHEGAVGYADLEDFRAQSRSFENLGGLRGVGFTLSTEEGLERISGAYVSADFFSVLGVEAAAGRLFHPSEDLPGAEQVAVISDAFWRDRFDSDPAAVGQAITLDRVGYTIVGVLPPRFSFPIDMSGADVWTTTAMDAATFSGRGSIRVKVVGRLKPEVTIAEAGADLRTIVGRLAQQYPAVYTDRSVNVDFLADHVAAGRRAAAFLILGVVGMVLLIACANVANMLLARTEGRRAEFAIRSALGAGRQHLVRQVLVEALLLASVGGALALLVVSWVFDTLQAFVGELRGVGVDWSVVCFTAAATAATAMMICLIPVFVTSRSDIHVSLKEGTQAQAGGRRRSLLSGVQVAQVAVAFMLLAGAGLLLRSVQKLLSVDPGFQTENLLTFQMSVPRSGFAAGDAGARARLYREVIDRLEEIPGVQSVGATTSLPLHRAYVSSGFAIVGREAAVPGTLQTERADAISPGYFETLGVPLFRGRYFTRRDTIGHPPVIIISESMAKRYWPNGDPLGERIDLGWILNDGTRSPFEIVGIVGDVKDTALDRPAEPCMYVSCDQAALRFTFFTLRTSGEPAGLVQAVRKEVAAITRDEAPFEFASMERLLGGSMEQRLAVTLSLGLFAAVAMGLSAVGLCGVVSFSVARRTREIGVRMALGGQRGHMLRMVLTQGLKLTTVGLGIGLLGSLALARALSSQLYEVSPADPITIVAVSTLLLVVALLACYFPARRATKVDPMVALRCE